MDRTVKHRTTTQRKGEGTGTGSRRNSEARGIASEVYCGGESKQHDGTSQPFTTTLTSGNNTPLEHALPLCGGPWVYGL